MRILICTPVFPPSIGGLETMNVLLAQELQKIGHEVLLCVNTPYNGTEDKNYSFTVIRKPSSLVLFRLYLWCDVFVHNAPTLKLAWPVFLHFKPFVIIHHSCTFNWTGKTNFQSSIKTILSKMAHNIAVSDVVGKSLSLKPNYKIIHNFYDCSRFKIYNNSPRKNFVYVGRLSHEKGVTLLVEAYSKYLMKSNKRYTLSIIGDGYEFELLQKKVKDLNLTDYIFFKGILKGDNLVETLNNAHAIILPTLCKEAFGIVLLEAMACGCYCLSSDGDGAIEASGNLGFSFKKGNVEDLSSKLLEIESINEECFNQYISMAKKHLVKFTLDRITDQYSDYLKSLVNMS